MVVLQMRQWLRTSAAYRKVQRSKHILSVSARHKNKEETRQDSMATAEESRKQSRKKFKVLKQL